ncbi:related to Putative hydroxyacid dehydrogenase [Zygosaccharomyces bailii ISA1307]|nr:related to Putative hydroxyacid dehydrogenase [Zygosaccharomyces bailii ISA1307]
MSNQAKPTVLFVAAPNEKSDILHSSSFNSRFDVLHHVITSRESFVRFLGEHRSANIEAIYGGYPAFLPIGGLDAELLGHEWFPRRLKCIVVCSRGHNGFDLDALRERNVQLYKYQDVKKPYDSLEGFRTSQVGNDVADCALWHVLEGFRKFSFQQHLSRRHGVTLTARGEAAATPDKFAFGHELDSIDVESPRGKSCLILGLGSIGKMIGLKLQYGLGMQIHYSKRSKDLDASRPHGWKFHKLDESLYAKLYQFHAIVVALPAAKETKHLIDNKFLSYCNGPELVLVNVGRGNVLQQDDVVDALKKGSLRHLGQDVFYREPVIDEELCSDEKHTTITPHIGSSTRDVFYQSCELALANIMAATDEETETDSLSRVV